MPSDVGTTLNDAGPTPLAIYSDIKEVVVSLIN